MLERACILSDPQDVDKLIDRLVALGVEPASVKKTDASPIGRCLAKGNFGSAWKLAELGAPLDYQDERGEGALHALAQESGKESLAALAKLMARPEMKAMLAQGSSSSGTKGELPLHRACSALNKAALELFLDAGADVNAKDGKGGTPLRHLLRKFGAKAQKKIEPLVRLLIERGADPSIADAKGRTPAQAAAAKAPLGALEILLGMRPQDLAGEGGQAKATKGHLEERGARGRSLSEQVQFNSELGVPVKSRAAKTRPKSL
jgi:ankyrin repeat protein